MTNVNATLKSASEWLREPQYYGVTIIDPDGWDRTDFDASFDEPITLDEFQRRLNRSTLQFRFPKASAR